MNKKYTVTGMTCSACSARVEKCVKQVEGVESVSVNLISGVLSVKMGEDKSDLIKEAVLSEGYGIKDGAPRKRSGERANYLLKRLISSAIFVIILMYISMGHMVGLPMPRFLHEKSWSAVLQFALSLPVLIINGQYFVVGFKKLFRLAPNMDTLVALGSAASFLFSTYETALILSGTGEGGSLFFEGAAMILVFITLGKFLEEKSKDKTMGAVEKLIDMTPDTAVIMRGEEEVEINISDLKAGDAVVLKDGFTVPADGVIIEGGGWADEAVITGESLPVYREKGSKVVCGSRFSGGYAIVRAESVGEDSTVYKIVKLVEEANSTKVPIAGLADKVAGVFVPVVMGISLTAFIVSLIAGAGIAAALNTAVSVLVVSCPCALGLATPAALMAGTGKAAENGILVKSGEALQNLAEINSVVLDKTGTITYGKPEIEDYRLIGELTGEEFLGICAAIERRSSHILGEPIIRLAESKGIEDMPVENFGAIAGEGVKGEVSGRICLIGNEKLMRENAVEGFDDISPEKEGSTLLFVAIDGKMAGYISIKDKIKPSSKGAIDAFKRSGTEVVMLTGDGESAARAVADELGVSYLAGVLPADKHCEVKRLTQAGKKVMMIGDGVNDAPALAEATVGLAIGAGTDVAIESADVVLIKSDLADAVKAVKLGKAVMLNIKENLFWAFFYNIILIPVACGALSPIGITLNPMWASLAMSLSSIFVVSNALRLRFFRYEIKNKEEQKMQTETVLYIDGMMCEHCKKRVEGVLKDLGYAAEVDLKNKCARISGEADESKIKAAIETAGYKYIGKK